MNLIGGCAIVGAGGSGPLACTITPSTTTPGLFASVTLTCNQSDYATYSWKAVSNLSSLRTQNVFSFTGQAITFRPIYDGTWDIELTVTNSEGKVGRATVTLTVSNGVRYCALTINTAPPSAGNAPMLNQAALSPAKRIYTGNHVSNYHANRLVANGQGGLLFRSDEYFSYSRCGISPTITWAGGEVQNSDPDWDWQVGGYAGNVNMGRSDNGTNVTFSGPTRASHNQYWFRMDRAVDGTVRLYVLDEISNNVIERYICGQIDWTLLHTYSLTTTSAMYIRHYVQSAQGHTHLYMYGETE